jgi:hypothetical protein
MKYSTYGAALLLSLLTTLAPAHAADATPAPKPVPAPLKPLTFDDGKGVFELVERLRYENRSDNFDFNSAAHSPTDDSWFVQRLRVGFTWKPDPGLAVQLQLQDAREWGSDRPKVPFILGAEGNDALDLRIASITWGDPKNSPVVFTIGRQVLAFGEERLIGPGDWNNFARTFDAGKLVWSIVPGKTTASFFVSSVVNIKGTALGDGWEFDESSGNDIFSGVYVTTKLDKTSVLDGYLLWRGKKHNDPIYTAPTPTIPAPARTAAAYDIGQHIFTLGTRYVRPPKEGALDAEFEGAWQWGNVNRQTTAATGPYAGSTPTLDQQAWAIHTLVGYTPTGLPGKLRLDLEYNVASGDTDRTDDTNGSFMTLFPSGHKWYGFMDVIGWKNLREFVATARLVPLPKTTVRIDYHDFSLYSSQDAWYRKNGVATVRPLNAAARNAPRSVGEELDLTLGWTPQPWVAVDLGWSRFFAGSYLSATGASSDADFFYLQTTLKF